MDRLDKLVAQYSDYSRKDVRKLVKEKDFLAFWIGRIIVGITGNLIILVFLKLKSFAMIFN